MCKIVKVVKALNSFILAQCASSVHHQTSLNIKCSENDFWDCLVVSPPDGHRGHLQGEVVQEATSVTVLSLWHCSQYSQCGQYQPQTCLNVCHSCPQMECGQRCLAESNCFSFKFQESVLPSLESACSLGGFHATSDDRTAQLVYVSGEIQSILTSDQLSL